MSRKGGLVILRPVEDAPAVVEIPLPEIRPYQLVNAQLINLYWPRVRPLLERCVKEAMHGEMEADDIRDLALAGKIILMVFTRYPDPGVQTPVELAIAIEPIAYPRLPAINIVAMGGTDFGLIQKQWWTYFKGWAIMNGSRAIEASVSPAMMRVLRRWGYKAIYTRARCDLMEE
jgi:hypothetical protein